MQTLYETYLRWETAVLKFKFNWASCILSNNPTNRQMPKKRHRGWNLLPLVSQTENKNKNNINNKPKGHYIGYLHRLTSQEENTITTPNAVARKHSRFPQSWFYKCFKKFCSSQYLFSFVGIKDKYYHKDRMNSNNGRSRYSMHTKSFFCV